MHRAPKYRRTVRLALAGVIGAGAVALSACQPQPPGLPAPPFTVEGATYWNFTGGQRPGGGSQTDYWFRRAVSRDRLCADVVSAMVAQGWTVWPGACAEPVGAGPMWTLNAQATRPDGVSVGVAVSRDTTGMSYAQVSVVK